MLNVVGWQTQRTITNGPASCALSRVGLPQTSLSFSLAATAATAAAGGGVTLLGKLSEGDDRCEYDPRLPQVRRVLCQLGHHANYLHGRLRR